MATIAEELEEEHHSIDARLADFVAGLDEGEVRADHFRDSAAELRRHIYVEELRLFPPLRETGMVPPVLVMLREHGELWGTLEAVERLLDYPTPDTSALRAECDRLAEQLDAHNQKEEVILYQAAVERLDPQTQEQVSIALVDEEMPAGWRCRLAP